MDDAQPQTPDYQIEFGKLAETYGLFVPETINPGYQISADRIRDKSLRNRWFYTANVSFATKRKGKLLLGIGGSEAFNAVFGTNTERVCKELADTGYINLHPVQKDEVLLLEKRVEVVFAEPKELDLRGQGSEYKQFPIRTRFYQKDVTEARAPFVSAGFGYGNTLGWVMDNLAGNLVYERRSKIAISYNLFPDDVILTVEEKADETAVFTMSPDNVAEAVKDDEIVARACLLCGFDNLAIFCAGYSGVGSNMNALRGKLESSTPFDSEQTLNPR